MLWHLHQVNSLVQGCGQNFDMESLEIVKFNNASYHHTIVIQGPPKFFFKAQLKILLKCLQYCIMANDSLDSLDDTKT
jgi:hypothetical protein